MAGKYVWPGGERRIPNNYESFSSLSKSCVMARLRVVLPYLQRNYTVLDLGCGVGWGTKFMSLYCSQVHGLDVSKEALDFAQKKNGAANVSWFLSNMFDLAAFAENQYDLVVSIAAIEHIDEAEMGIMLKECHRVLKPNGVFVGTTTKFHTVSKHNATKWHKFEPSIKDFNDMARKYFKVKTIGNFRIQTPDLVKPIVEGQFTLINAK